MTKLGRDIKEWERPDQEAILDGLDESQRESMRRRFKSETFTDKNALQNQGNVLVLCMAVRQVLIMALGAIEDYIGHDRTIVPRRKR